jgi:predicted ATPase
MDPDDAELLNKLKAHKTQDERPKQIHARSTFTEQRADRCGGRFVQWSTSDSKDYFPSELTVPTLAPGFYHILLNPQGRLFFSRQSMAQEELIQFPETHSQAVVDEIENFWSKESEFREYGLAFKRGILLWGPPGGGKTCTIKLAIARVVKRGGVVIEYNPFFAPGMAILREVQPDTPVICLMEDIDAILENNNESDVLNVLDGVGCMDKTVFLATTNYPERLGERVVNRPSRFDKRIKIPMPNAQTRRIYLKSIFRKGSLPDIERWVKDTKGMSVAHLKELFVSVVVLGDDYDRTIATLKSMTEVISSEQDRGERRTGFGVSGAKGED